MLEEVGQLEKDSQVGEEDSRSGHEEEQETKRERKDNREGYQSERTNFSTSARTIINQYNFTYNFSYGNNN